MAYASRFVVGTGSALNVNLGFIPDYARVTNLTGGDVITEGALAQVLDFGGGGTDELKGGMILVQNDDQSIWALVREVLVQSGTWAAGDAAGFIVLEPGFGNGTFGNSKQLSVAPAQQNPIIAPRGASGDWGTTASAAYEPTIVATANSVTSATGNAAISAYSGAVAAGSTEGAPVGVTLGSTVSESNNLLHIQAWREDPR